jgi:PTS system mannose-specific IID component
MDVSRAKGEPVGRPDSGAPSPSPEPPVGVATRMSIFTRLFAIQASWNYELLMGTGVGFCVEPALRHLPGGPTGRLYHEALARESQYFNAHPYLASVAVGALARAELDRVPGARIERFRTALCGPLGSVGDRLIWAGWLPVCSLLALAAYGLGARPFAVLAIFLGIYNLGHLSLRAWGVHAGWTHSLRVAPALSGPLFRTGPAHLARVGALLAGIALPVALGRVIGPGVGRGPIVGVVVATVAGSAFLARMHGRIEGWRIALGLLAAFVLFATVIRHG